MLSWVLKKKFHPKNFFHPKFFWVKQGVTQCYQTFLVLKNIQFISNLDGGSWSRWGVFCGKGRHCLFGVQVFSDDKSSKKLALLKGRKVFQVDSWILVVQWHTPLLVWVVQFNSCLRQNLSASEEKVSLTEQTMSHDQVFMSSQL